MQRKRDVFSNIKNDSKHSKYKSNGRYKCMSVPCNSYETNTTSTIVDDLDKDLNSGFGNYLRSDEGVEMMKLFVFANTIVMIVTMAWPHIQKQYYWLREWFENLRQTHID